ncbi:ATP-binding protein [Candidatus Pristimantibacillus sp. PTI5]|uniref:ATP-binding protein n=1 Tax=Candidatus Pristimantibacillus sp. PTI5 TaxID=3400422 RepID=UPI003B019054
MKLLNKLLMVNWHYIRHQMIDFERINFLTGKNATGKSTIIDALQLLMLGDTRGHYFNKAANDNSRRTLKGYLFGEKGYNESEGTVYLRKGIDFSSYLMAEFTNENRTEFFTVGISFDCYQDGNHDSKFFIFEDQIPEHHFIFESKTLSLNEMKRHMVQQYGKNKCEFYDSERGYRDAFKNSMGRIKGDFFDLFRKAVPFTPIMNIKQFITEFVCETQNKVEIEKLRENIRNYKTLEHHMYQINEKLSRIQVIESGYEDYLEVKLQLEKEQYTLDRAGYEDKEIELLYKIDQVKLKTVDHQEILKQIEVIEIEMCQNKEQLNKLRQEYYGSQDKRKLELLDVKIEAAKRDLDISESANIRVNQQLVSLVRSWSVLIQELEQFLFLTLSEAGHNTNELQRKLKIIPYEIDHTLLSQLQSSIHAVQEELREKQIYLRKELNELMTERHELGERIIRLKSGIPQYQNKELVPLRNVIAEELSSNYHTSVQVEIFCELIEIQDDKWKNAIEGYLNTQRFYLIVDPIYFNEALKIYDRLKFERGFYDIGLVDIGKIVEKKLTVLPGNLAEEVSTEHSWARAYVDYLLGRVMKCEKVEDLRQYQTAITPTCMSYSGYVAKQINPRIYQTPYIGRQSIMIQLNQAEDQVYNIENVLFPQIKPVLSQYDSWLKVPNLSDHDIIHLTSEDGLIMKANQREAQNEVWLSLRKEKDHFDLSYLQELEKGINAEEAREGRLVEKSNSLRELTGELKNEIDRLNREIPSLEETVQGLQRQIEFNFQTEWRKTLGEPYYAEMKTQTAKPSALKQKLAVLVEKTINIKEKQFERLVRLRTEYTKDYKGSLDNLEPTNDSWSAEKVRLQDTTLPDYEKQILAAKERASIEFQEDFIGKLKENIDIANEQIDELNYALKLSQFGRKKYRFDIKPNQQYKEYYRMITDDMLMDGRSIFTDSFLQKHGEIVEQLFQKIIYTGEDANTPEQAKELEENLTKFTDYRTYLDFDLLEVDELGNESSLSKVIATKSGGETQTPFYIAVLASFLQTYRVKSPTHNNTLRLILFDEAFSKMDHQRIQECIKLVRNMGLQMIISAPTDKLADIAPLVDRNLCVTRIRNETFVKAFDPQEFVEEETNAR